MESQIKVLKVELDLAQEQARKDLMEISRLKEKCENSENEAMVLRNKLQAEEVTRRRLHNTIQELKGNIRVFCRVRPLVQGETEDEGLSHIKYPQDDANSIVFSQLSESASGNALSKEYPFSFDKVFQPASCQKDVFEDISQLVQSALDGYNVISFNQTFRFASLHTDKQEVERRLRKFYAY